MTKRAKSTAKCPYLIHYIVAVFTLPSQSANRLRRALETFHAVLGPAHPYTKDTSEALEFAEMLAALEKLIGPEALADLMKRAAEQANQ